MISGLNISSLTDKICKYTDTPYQKTLKTNLILYVNSDGTIEVGKNRYTGVIGILDCTKGVDLLIHLLVGTAYNNTCEMFQEALKKDIYKVLEKHKILEGKNNNIQKGKVL